jgi:hypothetical protein
MAILRGKLLPTPAADLPGYRVAAAFTVPLTLADGTPTGELSPIRLVTDTAADGAYAIELPEGWRAPVHLSANAPTGVEVGSQDLADVSGPVDIAVTPVSATPVKPSDDPTLGRRERLTGRVMDQEGRAAPAGLLVVVWAVPKGGTSSNAFPLLVAETAQGGYFSELWPTEELAEAWARIAGAGPVVIHLDGNRLPRSVLLVAPSLPAPVEPHTDCACENAPPRAPDSVDLAANPGAFSADKGGGCVDLTVPNRALEEVTFHTVVRTSQPEIKGMTLPDPLRIPQSLVDRLSTLVTANESRRMRSIAGAASAAREAAVASPAAGGTASASLRLVPSVVADLVRDSGELTSAKLLNAERISLVRTVRDAVALVDQPVPGRVALDSAHLIDWDHTPTTYQATTIAHGHLLTLKQVWRADGYSLGDLLYSLPLAPGQKKLTAVVDWERREDAARQAGRRETEEVRADLVHDRDISEIINTALSQRMRGRSSADVEAVAGGIGGYIGPIVFGIGGGVSSAGSSASQSSFRNVTATSLNQARDRTLQSASSVRSQRTTVVQTARQGESVRVQTDVVANHNHCHALTIEYFEVLRHFQVTQELAHVQECLFVPFEVAPFTAEKALRHREPLARALRRRDVAGGFAALERMRTNWVDADYPLARYADEPIRFLDGELWITFALPRPADKPDTDEFDQAQWGPYETLLSQPTLTVWRTNLGTALPKDRDWIWNTRIAPRIAERLVNRLSLSLTLDDNVTPPQPVPIDVTLVSRFVQDRRLLVSLRPENATPAVVRARIKRVKLSLSAVLPATAKVVVELVSMRYRTDHLEHPLVPEYRAFNDIGLSDDVEIPVGLDRQEKRDPRREDMRLADTLVAHLNEHLEYYHQAIWLQMDPNRRYLLLDGFVAPNAGGRSVATVVENRLIGIVGNCLVMPVVPGLRLDKSYELAEQEPAQLIDLYASDPVPPMRISVPTKGVFAEAVMGACNSCEVKDDTRFWHWEDAPIPDEPTAIEQVSTATRRGVAPNLAPDEFPSALVSLQTAPKAPAMAGLAAALDLIGTPNLFGDLTGLTLNQQASAEAFDAASKTATFFAQQGGALAQQRFLNRDMDRTIKRIKDARDSGMITKEQAGKLTVSALKGAIGERRPAAPSPTDSDAVKRALDRVAEAKNSTLKVERPDGTVEVRKGEHAGGTPGGAIAFAVDPPVTPIQQTSIRTCWAAAGAMMHSWQKRQSLSIEALLDELGGDWRTKFDADLPLDAAQVVGFTKALGLTGNAPASITPRGFATLLQESGPLWVIGDDAVLDNHLVHVRIVTGIHGDGSLEGTSVTFVDPAAAASQSETFSEFLRRLETKDVIDLGLGVFHF